MKVSIVIPVKDNIDVAICCIQNFMSFTEDKEIIVINDGSHLETTTVLKRYADEITLIENKKSLGWCKAINQGLAVAKGDYIALANSDIVVTPNWFKKIEKHFNEHPEVGIIGPTSNQVNTCQHVDYNKPGVFFEITDVLQFFFVVLNRKILNEVGNLDEDFGMGGNDDFDYCIRAKKSGFNVGIARDVFVYHYGSATFREEFKNDIKKSKDYAESRHQILANKHKIKKPKIFIAIPSASGHIVNELVSILISWTHDPRWTITLQMPKGMFPLDNARNHCVEQFLKSDADYLLWIDDDIVPPINTIEQFIQADKDIIGAAAFSMKYENGVGFPYPVTLRFNEEKKYEVYYGNGIEECDATGGACVMFKRKVYEAIERPYEFYYNRNGTLALTCDFVVFQKAKEAGFKLFIDYNVVCDHIRTASIKGFQNLLVKNIRED